MDPFQNEPLFAPTDDATAVDTAPAGHDADATPSPQADAAASPTPPASRHLYTMTVDQALAELYAHALYRDVRTVQRWCKSGRLRAIIDEVNGDRYLIDPASLREVVATLLAERDATPQRAAPTPRPEPRRHPDSAATGGAHGDNAATTGRDTFTGQADTTGDAAAQEAAEAATSQKSRDEVAALERRIAELEREKSILEVDKRVREELVDYPHKFYLSLKKSL